MTDNKENDILTNKMGIPDFVGIDENRKRVCVSGHKDNFVATYINGCWRSDYPEFDDLMDNYIEMKDKERAEKYSNYARTSINT
jgi:hypothetical protein